MDPVDFPEANLTLTKPAGVTDEECGSLRAHRTADAFVSCWQPTEEERAAIARGGAIWLWVWAAGHPPVALSAECPFPRASEPPAQDARQMPDGTLVTCEHCPTPHPKGDDGRPCLFPKVAPPRASKPAPPACVCGHSEAKHTPAGDRVCWHQERNGDRCPCDHFAAAEPAPHDEASPDDLRAAGWVVAVHNDYRLNGEPHTFWLFTKGDRCVKGEGHSDREALSAIRSLLQPARSAPRESRAEACATCNGKREVSYAVPSGLHWRPCPACAASEQGGLARCYSCRHATPCGGGFTIDCDEGQGHNIDGNWGCDRWDARRAASSPEVSRG